MDPLAVFMMVLSSIAVAFAVISGLAVAMAGKKQEAQQDK